MVSGGGGAPPPRGGVLPGVRLVLLDALSVVVAAEELEPLLINVSASPLVVWPNLNPCRAAKLEPDSGAIGAAGAGADTGAF